MLIGYDPNGVRRVWGMTPADVVDAIRDYLARRPDTGPLSKWSVRPESVEPRLCEHG